MDYLKIKEEVQRKLNDYHADLYLLVHDKQNALIYSKSCNCEYCCKTREYVHIKRTLSKNRVSVMYYKDIINHQETLKQLKIDRDILRNK